MESWSYHLRNNIVANFPLSDAYVRWFKWITRGSFIWIPGLGWRSHFKVFSRQLPEYGDRTAAVYRQS